MFSLIVIVLVALLYVGCASEPTQEINDAQTAIEAAITDGANTYTQAEIKGIQDNFTAAVEEAKANTGKLFKSNDEAKKKLVQIKTDAEALKATVATKKEEAKNNALNLQKEIQTAIEEAKGYVEKAPKGKGTQADIEAFNTDLTALNDSLPEVQKLIDGEDFLGAVEKGNTIKEKATGISDQIKQAIEKVEAEKAAKKGKK